MTISRRTIRLLVCALGLPLVGCGSIPFRGTSDGPWTTRVGLDSSTDRNRAASSIQLAEQFAARGQDDLAIEQYLRARQFQPSLKGTAHPLAVLYDRQGRIDNAEREYQAAIRESPRDANLLNDYGYFLYSQGDYLAADEWLHRALNYAPDHKTARVNLALSAAEQERYEEALLLFERAVGPAAAHHNVGVVLARHGRMLEAEQHLLAAVKRDPSLELTGEVMAWIDADSSHSPEFVLTGHETETW
ncbi:MAG: tetratricopeptide repeat protein [Planctomycetaceae bacterium]